MEKARWRWWEEVGNWDLASSAAREMVFSSVCC